MAYLNPMVRRIFGGTDPAHAPTTGNQQYTRELTNPADQTVAETLIVGTTRRIFRGPEDGASGWSYHINNLSASGATSTLKFYYSDLPDPDPTNAAHWKDSGITAIDLTVVAVSFGNLVAAFPEWIKAEAVAVTSAGTLWGYVKSSRRA